MTKIKFFFILLVLATFFSWHSPATAQSSDIGPNLKELGPLIARLINYLLGIVGGISIILIIVGGIRFIAAGGDEKATAAAKQTVTFAIVGLVIVLLAVLMVNILGGLLGVKDLNIVRFEYRP